MRAVFLDQPGAPLRFAEVPDPEPGPDEVLVAVRACGVCRTDLHLVDGELPHPRLPVIPGHQVVGRVVAAGAAVQWPPVGERVGIPWLGWACGSCRRCRAGRENLCPAAEFTGYTRNGGFADRIVADSRFCLPLPDGYDDIAVAPLLCAGLIGYRALRATEDPAILGLYGFGAAAHIVIQVCRYEGRRVFGFVRPGDAAARDFALDMGCEWVGASTQLPPEPLDAAIIFAPAGELVPAALRAVAPGGVVVCGGIHMSNIPSFPYALLWEERVVRSIANLTRRDGHEFLALAPKVPVRTTVETYDLSAVATALDRLRRGEVRGAAVLVVA